MMDITSTLLAAGKAAGIFAAGYVLGKALSSRLEKLTSKKVSTHVGRIVKNIVFYSIVVVASLTAVSQFVDLTAVLAAAGIAGIAIGLASQRSVSNIISGIFLVVDNPFSIGDAVNIDGTEGFVIDMTLLSTRLRTFDNKYLRVPNETVAAATITNYTKFHIRRVDLTIGVAYKEDVGKAIDVLTPMVKALPDVLVEPEPQVFATEFGDSSINLIVRAWVPRTELFKAKSELVKGIKKSLDDAGIEIPFPHRTIYFGSGEIDKLNKVTDK